MILSPRQGGFLLGLVVFAAVVLVKPIGVSTQFVIFDGMLWDFVAPDTVVSAPEARSGYSSLNEYLDKSGGKYAKSVANPVNYSFLFVISMILGSFISVRLRGGVAKRERAMPEVWRANFGDSIPKRFFVSFLAGFVVLFGARLAGGCTSGHMMSGMMQTALSGYLFTAGVFLAGIPIAVVLFKKEG